MEQNGTTYTYTISFPPSSSFAKGSWNPQPAVIDGKLQFNKNDTLQFGYAVGASVLASVLINAEKNAPSQQPLFSDQGNSIDLLKVKDAKLKIAAQKGDWGFTVALCIAQPDGAAFYFVPDPELQVGST